MHALSVLLPAQHINLTMQKHNLGIFQLLYFEIFYTDVWVQTETKVNQFLKSAYRDKSAIKSCPHRRVKHFMGFYWFYNARRCLLFTSSACQQQRATVWLQSETLRTKFFSIGTRKLSPSGGIKLTQAGRIRESLRRGKTVRSRQTVKVEAKVWKILCCLAYVKELLHIHFSSHVQNKHFTG